MHICPPRVAVVHQLGTMTSCHACSTAMHYSSAVLRCCVRGSEWQIIQTYHRSRAFSAKKVVSQSRVLVDSQAVKKLLEQTYLKLNEFHGEGASETSKDDLFACDTFIPLEITSDIFFFVSLLMPRASTSLYNSIIFRRHPDLSEEVIWRQCRINLLKIFMMQL